MQISGFGIKCLTDSIAIRTHEDCYNINVVNQDDSISEVTPGVRGGTKVAVKSENGSLAFGNHSMDEMQKRANGKLKTEVVDKKHDSWFRKGLNSFASGVAA
jgi:hypothetical protein